MHRNLRLLCVGSGLSILGLLLLHLQLEHLLLLLELLLRCSNGRIRLCVRVLRTIRGKAHLLANPVGQLVAERQVRRPHHEVGEQRLNLGRQTLGQLDHHRELLGAEARGVRNVL